MSTQTCITGACIKGSLFVSLVFSFALMLPNLGSAHFVWIVKHNGEIKIVFAEDPEPDNAKFLDGLTQLKPWQFDADDWKELKLEKQIDGESGWLRCKVNDSDHPVVAACNYGVVGKDRDDPKLLQYFAKYIDLSDSKSNETNDNLTLDIIPAIDEANVTLTVLLNGKPAKDIKLMIECDKHFDELKTDSHGKVVFEADGQERFWIRAKATEATDGKLDGEEYGSISRYCTLVIDLPKSE